MTTQSSEGKFLVALHALIQSALMNALIAIKGIGIKHHAHQARSDAHEQHPLPGTTAAQDPQKVLQVITSLLAECHLGN